MVVLPSSSLITDFIPVILIVSAQGTLGAQNICARLARANHTILHSS